MITDKTRVRLLTEADGTFLMTLGEFFSNEDAINTNTDYAAEIREALDENGIYIGGGGCSPVWKLEVMAGER